MASVLQRFVARYVYLKQYPTGQHVASRRGEVGVLRKTTLDDYVRFFGNFHVLARGDAIQITSASPHGNPVIDSNSYDYLLFERNS